MPRTIAIIPARAGSRRIPNKNSRILGVTPLWRYTANVALACRAQGGLEGFDEVWVSSDDHGIRTDAAAAGCKVYREMPGEFGTMRLLRDEVVRFSRTRPEWVVMLLPTYPFRSVRDLRGLLERLGPKIDEVQSATWIARCSMWLPNSYLAAVRWDNGLCTGVHPPQSQFYFGIDHRRGTDIDTEDDWARAERLLPAFDFETGEWRDDRIELPRRLVLTADDLPKVADRFARLDQAWSGNIGGAE